MFVIVNREDVGFKGIKSLHGYIDSKEEDYIKIYNLSKKELFKFNW